MHLLSVDTEKWKRIKPRYRTRLSFLPVVLTFAGLILTGYFSSAYAEYLGIDWYSSAKAQQHGLLWGVVSFVIVMPTLMLGGCLLGYVVNAAVLLFVFGWPPDRIRALFLFSEPPDSWLNPDLASDGSFPVVARKNAIIGHHVLHVLGIFFLGLFCLDWGTSKDGSLMVAGAFLAASAGMAYHYMNTPIELVITEAGLEVIYHLHRRTVARELVGPVEVQYNWSKAGEVCISIQGEWWRLRLVNFDPGGTELAHILMAWKDQRGKKP